MERIAMKTDITRWFVVAIAATTWCVNGVQAQESFDANEADRMMSFNTVELKDQLRYGLRVAFPEQEAFVAQVVEKVDTGEMSRAMVNVVFVWSRKRNPRIPFPYFEAVLRLLAERRGIELT
jgi:uncharacterized MAPEG superfamily protein